MALAQLPSIIMSISSCVGNSHLLSTPNSTNKNCSFAEYLTPSVCYLSPALSLPNKPRVRSGAPLP